MWRLSMTLCLVLVACPSSGPLDIPCRSNANCPTGSGCSAAGVCEKGIVGVSGSQLLVTPQVVNVLAGGTVAFTASLDGTASTEVTWVVTGAGAIDDTGRFTAPPTVPADPLVTITATSTQNPLATANALLTIRQVLPVPTLSTISPDQAAVGSPTLTLTATGTDFGPTTDLRFDDVLLQTSFVSATELTAVVPAELLAMGKSATLVAITPGLGGQSVGATFTVNNPRAVLGAITPTSAVAGAPGLTLALSGSNFAPGVVVTFDGAPLTTTLVTSTQLTAVVPTAALASAGVVTVAVRNPAPGGGGIGDQLFRIEPSIRTLMGGFTGDDGPAAAASLTRVSFAAMSPAGELHYSETERHRVMKVDLSGRVRRVAGLGSCAFGGEGGAATAASVCSPKGLAFDAAGNLYIGDAGNYRIRRVDVTGNISTFAGNGVCAYAGEGPATTVPVGDVSDIEVLPSGVVYFTALSCTGHQRVRRIATNGVTTTVAGNGTRASAPNNVVAATAPLNSPLHLAVDAFENVYISEFDGHTVRRVDGATGVMSVFAGTGGSGSGGENVAATSAGLAFPRGVELDAQGNLLIASSSGYRVRKVDLASTDGGLSADGGLPLPTMATVIGNGMGGVVAADGLPALTAAIGRPAAILVVGATVYFSTLSDTGAAPNTIKRLDATNVVRPVVGGTINNTTAAGAFLFRPWGIAYDAAGNAYVSDRENDRIWKVAPGGMMSAFAGTGVRGFAGDGSPAADALLSAPEQLQVDAAGDLYFLDVGNARVRKVDTQGTISTVAGGGAVPAGCSTTGMATTAPVGAGPAFNCYGDDYFAANAVLLTPRGLLKTGTALFISEYDNSRAHRVRRVELTVGSPRLNFISTLAGSTTYPLTTATTTSGFAGDGAQSSTSLLFQPTGLVLDAAGDLVFADAGNRRLRKINLVSAPLGVITTISGDGTANSQGNGGQLLVARWRRPWSLVFAANQDLYVTDLDSHNLRRVDTLGVVTPVAGSQTCSTCPSGFSGDGQAAKDALLAAPGPLTLGPQGQVVFGDVFNERVRAIGP